MDRVVVRTGSGLGPVPPVSFEPLTELLPLLRRAVGLEPRTLTRLRQSEAVLTGFVQLPFGVLVGRSIRLPSTGPALDVTIGAEELLEWASRSGQDAARPDQRSQADTPFPSRRDTEWRGSLPPVAGWQRLDTVPEPVLRRLVDSGVRALADAAAREGLPGAEPRAEVTDALLDSTVLTVSREAESTVNAPTVNAPTVNAPTVQVSLRMVSAALRMGFAPPGAGVAVDLSGRWTRLCAPFGNVYAEKSAFGLALRV